MALSSSQLSLLTSNPCSSFSLSLFSPQFRTPIPHSFRTLKFVPVCSQNARTYQPQRIKIDLDVQKEKKKRKPRPSFYEQIREKWSLKPVSQRQQLPWEAPERSIQGTVEHREEKGEKFIDFSAPELTFNGQLVGFTEERLDISSQVVGQGVNRDSRTQTNSGLEANEELQLETEVVPVEVQGEVGNTSVKIDGASVPPLRTGYDKSVSVPLVSTSAPWVNRSRNRQPLVDYSSKIKQNGREVNGVVQKFVAISPSNATVGDVEETDFEEDFGASNEVEEAYAVNEETTGSLTDIGDIPFHREPDNTSGKSAVSRNKRSQCSGFESSGLSSSAQRLPWTAAGSSENFGTENYKRSYTEQAEKMIPEHELRRLRNISLRMMERIKVGAAGITLPLVETIHKKWKIDEVVKLKFEGSLAMNMKRTHEIVESKTGGLVIWRSGSSIVLYRGMSYNLDCVQSYSRQHKVSEQPISSSLNDSLKFPKNLSDEELMDFTELNHLLDDIGPRYVNWSGFDPVPVDADLLPSVVPGYKTPFRLLPHGIKSTLKDKETTYFRRLARKTPPHFALGRNRELQGLAVAMVKLWKKCAISKIAIKRGVLNTCNERMAEELKRLTGGTLLSRNKEYIVFYRGNDFLPPAVVSALQEREQLAVLQHQEEEAIREASASINLKAQAAGRALFAGTLSETVVATSRWGSQPTKEDVGKMRMDSSLERHAALHRYLQKKLALAKGKLKKADKALAKVQKSLEPADLPSDLETITDEERYLLHKIGSSMKPFQLLGKRGIFDGTVESMHLHWKYREVVKIIVKEQNFAQVKHIAISLEAESGGVLVSIDKTAKGYAIIVYRGKNYRPPLRYKAENLLTKRQALARSIELQRREALKHHILDLEERMALVSSELEDMKDGKQIVP